MLFSGISYLLQKLTVNASSVIYLFIHSRYLPFHLYCTINMLNLSIFNLIIYWSRFNYPDCGLLAAIQNRIIAKGNAIFLWWWLLFRLIDVKKRKGNPTPSWVQLLETSYICLFYYIFLATIFHFWGVFFGQLSNQAFIFLGSLPSKYESSSVLLFEVKVS